MTAGLTRREAASRLQQFGPNALPRARPDRLWRRAARQFRSPLIYILLFALLVQAAAWLIGRDAPPWEGIAIAVILVLNAALGVWQERKAEHALAELARLAAPHVWVVRDGEIGRLPAEVLVPGDVVRLEAGDRVPADIVPEHPDNLIVDESILTGESIPVDKAHGEALHAGTLVVRGTTYGTVARTGPASAMGRLVGALESVRPEPTPLERRLDAFGRRVARWVMGLAFLVLAGGLVADGWSRLPQVFLFAVSLAVAAVPESLPAVLTLTLALGVQRMARRKAVVRRLSAVEALGSVTVIASDKTGTMTENRLEVRRLETADRDRALRAMVLASTADEQARAGDPLELALIRYAAAAGVRAAEIREASPAVSTRSFESGTRSMRTTVREDGRAVSYFKGAPEVLLEQSTLRSEAREEWLARMDGLAAKGLRLIGLAWREGDAERDLTWLGIVGLWDPPRTEVPGAVQRALAAGIRVLMVTGDHGATAASVAQAVGIPDPRVLTGDRISAMPAGELQLAVRTANVFARVGPEHKLAIVDALRANGDVVAVTGDGVNDAAALKRADVGIAMGQRGSDVTREVADLVLLDDNFSTIIAAVDEGRGIYANIQKFIRFLFSTNLSEILVVLAGSVLALAIGLRDAAGALFLPLTAAQLLWINLVTDGAPAIALSLDRNTGMLAGRPRPAGAPLLDRVSLRFIGFNGGIIALAAVGVAGVLWGIGESLDRMRAAGFVFLGLAQLFSAYAARRMDRGLLPNRFLHVAILSGVLLQVGVVYLPGLNTVLHSMALSPRVAGVIAAGCAMAWAGTELVGRRLATSRALFRDSRPPAGP